MKYISTRGKSAPRTSAEAIKKGLAEDGGLYFPDETPLLTDEELKELCEDGYAVRAAKIMYKFLADEYTYEELLTECEAAYREDSFPGGAAPVTKLGDTLRVLELWHGPTAAFKDMALQIMPRLFVRAVKKTGDERKALILVATSGDTGKAALEGYRDVEGVGISVFYPVNGVSRVQKLQMATQEGKNVEVHSVIGNFDDAQNGVKQIFGDAGIVEKLNEKGVFLSSANSINRGRLVPQVVYYVSVYCDLVACGDIALGEEINVCVPTGNFGNILAAYIAKNMGLPIFGFVCASNQNNVLTDFFE
ncbi:MAG: threonine synthase, partial [Clostridia bacterium]|nr:threonine synthase [Clostridia bacterium]